jgi:nitroreductase
VLFRWHFVTCPAETWPRTTLKSFVSFLLWQCGHSGFSSPRMSSSTFWLHSSQEYSYNRMGFGSQAIRTAIYIDTFDVINQRRSVKAFDPAHRFSDAEERQLLEAAIQSPTSFNMQNWRFVIVRDPELRKQIRAAAVDQSQATDASLLIVLTADLKAWKKSPERYWRNASPEIQKLAVGWMVPFYEGKEQLQRDEAMRSCGIAGQTIMLAAKSMGYDSCPMIGFDPVKVAEIINLPSDHVISFMVAVGKAVKPAWPKGGQLDLAEVMVENRSA